MVVVVVVLEMEVTWEREAVCITRYWPREMMVCRLDIYVCMYVKGLYVCKYVRERTAFSTGADKHMCVYSVKEKVCMNVCM